MAEFKEKTLVCTDCGTEFPFTAEEQQFYAEKGFDNEPKRCKECRIKKKQDFRSRPREMFTIECSNCGKEDQVPFKPTEGRPVLCRDCFMASKER